ncbi:MAG: cobalamin B12-binding domain-containing protein [Ruminococcaceae bacterium]|nr:cobalamin B12-binding domain-containing protein [Oscillospiraceae bacterium]
MNPSAADFIQILEEENRYEALRFILALKENNSMSILEIYENYLTVSLNSIQQTGNEDIDIWREHVRTSIIKTILENLYPYVIKVRLAPNRRTVAVICPPEEYHDIGARMVSDMLTIYGYDTVYVGGNTPLRVFEAGLATRPFDYVAISISNPYHLVSARKIINSLRASFPETRIIVGGSAIGKLHDNERSLNADLVAYSLKDLADLERGIK